MSHDGAYGKERDVYHDDDNVDAEAEDMDVEDAASEVKDTTSEVPATGDEEGQEEKGSVLEEDEEEEDDDGYGGDHRDEEELEQGEIHEDEEGIDDEEEEEEGEIHEDEDGLEEEDADMGEHHHEEHHDEAEEHADDDAQEQAQTEEENKSELNYSTRGRTPVAEAAVAATAAVDQMTDIGIREMFEELGKAREPLGTGASFLDSLTEEERRTRTRFLPDVEGFHQLRKNEVKSDLVLARSLISAAAPSSTRRSRGKRNRGDEDAMEEDDEDGVEPSEDERGSDNGAKVGSMFIDLRTTNVTVPSNALVSPPPLQNGPNGDSSESRDNSTVPSSRRWHNQIKSPLVVEAITAFNPPRPPESVGGKKKHRMLRWERRPTDIEDDLNIYRKTVQRTREELQSAERERERIETVSAHLRRHYLGHLGFMNEEWAHLSLELRTLREECSKVVQNLSSKMKHPGKANHVMEEALWMLKTLGAELKEAPAFTAEPDKPSSGVGGISSTSFIDWGRSTKVSSTEIASSWILPRETVTTPYGEGVVLRVFGATPTFTNNPKDDGADTGSGAVQANSSTKSLMGLVEPDGQKSGGNKDESSAKAKLSARGLAVKSRLGSVLPPRVCVRLAYGVGFFQATCVFSKANPATLSDSMLAQRWLKMAETAHHGGENLDIEGMAYINELADKIFNDTNGDETSANDMGKAVAAKGADSDKSAKSRLLPFGAGLLPTSNGRGGLLADAAITEVESGMYGALYEAKGILGKHTNEGVPALFKDWEDLRQEKYTLKAKALQLGNELLRQRRTRLLNDRTLAATKDRCQRIESLANEMKSDLNTLKERLDEELAELGIDQELAEDLLKMYFKELEESMLQEEANARQRMAIDDYANGLEAEGGKSRAADGHDFSDEEDHLPQKARVGQ